MADKGFTYKIRHVLRLFKIMAKMDLAWLLRDTKYAIACIISDLIANMGVVSGVFLIASRFGGMGGLTPDEVLFMMAYNAMVTGVFIVFGSGNNIHISRIIGRGQLEHLFIQPVPLGTQLLTMGFVPFTGGGSFIVGAVLAVVALQRIGFAVTPLWIIALAAYLFVTIAIIAARSYLVASAAFYAPAAAEEISTMVIDGTYFISTFPLSGMPLSLQIPLITVMPEGLVAWFPAMCLLGKPPFDAAYYPFVFAFILSFAAYRVFKRGLGYYVKKGSNRYVPDGFRG